jgi:hypothetical protein
MDRLWGAVTDFMRWINFLITNYLFYMQITNLASDLLFVFQFSQFSVLIEFLAQVINEENLNEIYKKSHM